MEKIMDKLQENISRNRYDNFQLPPVQPIYYPFPPNMMSRQDMGQTRYEKRNRRMRTSIRDEDSFLAKKYKKERLKQNMRKWKKVAHAILFTIKFRKHCHQLRTHRQLVFQRLKGTLKSNLHIIKEDLFKLLKNFFKVMIDKNEVTFDIQDDQHK